MTKLTFQWNSVPKLTLDAEVHRLVPKLFRAEVTRAEHRLPQIKQIACFFEIEYLESVWKKFHILPIRDKAVDRTDEK